jgi:TonB family protein
MLLLFQVTPAPAPVASATPIVVASPVASASPIATATPSCKVHNRDAHGSMMNIFSDSDQTIGSNSMNGMDMGRQGGTARAAGTAEVQVLVKANGDVGGVHLFTSSGSPSMDQIAMNAAAQGTYTPAIKNCVPVDSVIVVSP